MHGFTLIEVEFKAKKKSVHNVYTHIHKKIFEFNRITIHERV